MRSNQYNNNNHFLIFDRNVYFRVKLSRSVNSTFIHGCNIITIEFLIAKMMAAATVMVFTIARMLYVQFSRRSRQVVSDLQSVEACVLCADREVQRVYDHVNPSFLRSLVKYPLFLRNYNNSWHCQSNWYQLCALSRQIWFV